MMSASIGGRLRSAIAALNEVRTQTEDHLARSTNSRQARRGDVSELGGLLRSTLREHGGEIDGIGIATTKGYLADSRYWIEWWRFDRHRDLEFVAHSLNPSRDIFYDYSTLDWFTRPLKSHAVAITGPYVDFGGTNASTVTLARPVFVDGACVAVTGADIHTAHFESYLVSAMAENLTDEDDLGRRRRSEDAKDPAQPASAILVNSDNRVITSNSADHLPGDLIDRSTLTEWEAAQIDVGSHIDLDWWLFLRS